MYAKKFGGAEVKSVNIDESGYTLGSVAFVTGPSSRTVEIGVWRPAGTARGDFFVDDFELVESSLQGSHGGKIPAKAADDSASPP